MQFAFVGRDSLHLLVDLYHTTTGAASWPPWKDLGLEWSGMPYKYHQISKHIPNMCKSPQIANFLGTVQSFVTLPVTLLRNCASKSWDKMLRKSAHRRWSSASITFKHQNCAKAMCGLAKVGKAKPRATLPWRKQKKMNGIRAGV